MFANLPAIIGLLLKPVKTRVVPHKVGLISQSEGFVCRVLLHTYHKHTGGTVKNLSC